MRAQRRDFASLAARMKWDAAFGFALFVASFALYARTVAPGVLDADGGEFQTNIFRLGVSHTGYPLYFLLAKVWTLIFPFGSIAYRANLFSSLFGAITVALVYATMRVLATSRGAAFFTAALFAVSRVEWSQALVPDVYTLNSFFVVLVILLAVLWRAGRISLLWLVFAYGLSLTHHRTMIWIAPALALFVLVSEGRALLHPRRLIPLLLAFSLPLLLYLYIPLRGDSDVGVEYHAANKVNVLALNVLYDLRLQPTFLWSRVWTTYVPLLVEQFTSVGFALGLLGIVTLARNRAPRGFPVNLAPRDLLLLLGVAHLFETAFALAFWVVDSEIFFIPSYLTFLFFVGIGLARALDGLYARHYRLAYARQFAPLAFATILAGICAWLVVTNFPRVDQSGNDAVETRWQEIFSQPLEAGATLMGNWESLTPLEYYQYVEQTRTDLKRVKLVLYTDQLKLAPQGDVRKLAEQKLDQGDSIYLTVHPAQTETLVSLTELELAPIASLWRVACCHTETPFVLDVPFGDNLLLRSFGLSSSMPRAGDFVVVNLYWLPHAPLDTTYYFSLRLRDARGNLWMQRDGEPAGGLAPVGGWAPGKLTYEKEGFFVPPDAPPGVYSLELALYDAHSHEPLRVEGKSVATLGTIQVLASNHNPPLQAFHIPLLANGSRASDALVGYGLSEPEPRTADSIELSTWWRGLPDAASQLEVTLRDGRNQLFTVGRAPLFANAPAEFNPAQIIRARHSVILPPQAAPGHAALTLNLTKQSGEIQTYDLGAFDLRASDRQFTAPRVSHLQLAAFGSSIQFIGYELDRQSFKPGETFKLKLYWHATQAVNQSYTVFVHLLDARSVLRAQQDSIPRGGELPTDRWLPGEYVQDVYTLTIPPDAEAGDYQIEIGQYSADSQARLAAFDGNGAPLADNRVLLDSLIRVAK